MKGRGGCYTNGLKRASSIPRLLAEVESRGALSATGTSRKVHQWIDGNNNNTNNNSKNGNSQW